MVYTDIYKDYYKISDRLLDLSRQAEIDIEPLFKTTEEICAYNELKVLSAFSKHKVSDTHFKGSTGYGYGDVGRDTLDDIFASIFGTESALVRHNFVSGTHALSVCLFGLLRPDDIMVSITGKPYDTMEEVIGITGKKGDGSLTDFGVIYKQLDLTEDSEVDFENLEKSVLGAKVVYIQRSKGYSLRKSLTISQIKQICEKVRLYNESAIIVVDNCYGEFVEKHEPTEVGADVAVGSLIKNPGGGIAKTGGYIVGKAELIELCAYRLTCVGMGKEVGCTLNALQDMYMGVFYAPSVVCSAVKTSIFATRLFSLLGFETFPKYDEPRTDIIAAIKLEKEENLLDFCKGIQFGSPVDSFVTPLPWAMPGYDSEVIMAAGAFNMGASIEISADGPMIPPYNAYFQGGITYNTGKLAVMLAASHIGG